MGNAATWKLRPGVYHLASLHIENDARVEVLGPVQIRIAGRLNALDRTWIVPAAGVSIAAGDLRIEVSGKNGASGSITDWPKSAQLANVAHVSGVMLVPNGTLQFGASAVLKGAYLARDIHIDNDGTVNFESGVGPSGCLQSCDDGLPCTIDACTDGTCTHVNAPAGTSCADGDACNGAETCNGAGLCLPGTPPPPCQALDQCHDVGVCDQVTGLCSNPERADGYACNDGQENTEGDACTMGQCQGTKSCAPVAEVSAGGAHTCAIREDGSLWCWGRNLSGQLGTGTQDESLGPTRIGDTTWHWEQVSAGASHTCAVRVDKTLWCWGDNTFGQVGDGTTDTRTSPVKIGATEWKLVQAGERYTCGVSTAGALLCWGDNASGNLGNGTQDSSLVPVEAVGSNWTAVAVGHGHACGIQSDNTLWCWGANDSGQLGEGTTEATLTPVQLIGTDWVSVTAGPNEGDAFTCATRLDSSLWCWGDNASGQLGVGTQGGSSSVPIQLTVQGWSAVSAAGRHVSAVMTDGLLLSWGENQVGQLGDGSQTRRLSPVRILGNDYQRVAAGQVHGCGIRQYGGLQYSSLWCWGDNASGALGPDVGEMSLSPIQVADDLCGIGPICGNGGEAEDGEECDDGNNQDGDRCSWDCKVEKCFDVVCEQPSNQCEVSTCDPVDGQCRVHSKQDGTACNDSNGCTQTDLCQAGLCRGGDSIACQADECHEAGTCDPESGQCSHPPIDKMGCNINLLEPAVAKMPNGTYIAIFGYESTAETPFHPTENTVTPSRTESPYPPAYLLKGTHQGAFLPRLNEGETITWTVDGQPKSATANPATALTPTPNGSGTQVNVGGTVVALTPDLNSYLAKPDDPVGDEGIEPMPTGDDFEPTLPGQLNVNGTGAAVYTVPIKIPPGIGGMAPNLNLVYNSQSGYGIAGIGWNMTGLSVIHRCPKTLASDGYSQPINMDGASVASDGGDGVCLDGKRLLWNSSLGKFRAEMEDFADIAYLAENDRFVVTTKSGEKRIYGQSTRVQFPMEDTNGIIKTDAGNSKVTAIWALDRVEDLWGNFYELGYNEGGTGGLEDSGLLVTSINYTGHTDGHVQTPGAFTLGFEYEGRSASEADGDWPDTGRTRFRDSYLPNNKRLKAIRIRRNGETGELAHYELDYHLAIGIGVGPRSRLISIEYCAGDQCATSNFGWGTESGDPSVVDWSAEQKNYLLRVDRMGPGTQLVDINGDGLVDLVQAVRGYGESHVWLNTGAGWIPKDEWKLPEFVALGEPKVPIGENIWASQAWQDLRCVIPGTDQTYPEAVECRSEAFLDNCCDGWGACHPEAKCLDDQLKAKVDPDGDDLPDLTPSGTIFADINGDGLPDLITDREPGTDGKKPSSASPAVYFNKTRTDGSSDAWERQDELSGDNLNQVLQQTWYTKQHPFRLTWENPDEVQMDEGKYWVIDIDGDGRAEIVAVDGALAQYRCLRRQVFVFRVNQSTGRWEYDPGEGQYGWDFIADTHGPYVFADANRDGLPDVLDTNGYLLVLNAGKTGKGLQGSRWYSPRIPDPKHPSNRNYDTCGGFSMPTDQRKYLLATGDVDGDGIHDNVVMKWKDTGDGTVIADPPSGQTYDKATKFFMGTGMGWNDSQADAFWGGLLRFTGPNAAIDARLLTSGGYRFHFADLNADGRADAIVNYRWGGLFLLNTGVKFVDVEGHTSWLDFLVAGAKETRPVPTKLDPWFMKAAEPFDSFIDLDGDGISDRIQLLRKEDDDTEVFKGAWLNKYQRPVIRTFPNGLARGTAVKYVSINTLEGRGDSETQSEAVYTDTNERPLGTKHMAAPVVVVQSVVADDGIGAERKTSYRYKNLRASSIGKGPLGFREVTASDEATGIETTTTYAQAYPYTGMPRMVVRKDSHGQRITETETSYCYRRVGSTKVCSPEGVWNGNAGEAGVFVHPWKVKDTTFLRDTGGENSEGQASIVTETEFKFDGYGNAYFTGVTISSGDEKYIKTVANDYGSAGSETAIRGKPLSTTVESQRLLPLKDGKPGPTLQQVTAFEYTAELAISTKMVQRNAGFGTELHTAYHYDTYGNLDITTACASDFEACEAGADNPNADPSDPLHPPFRSSYVSFKVAEFDPGVTAPTRSLAYGDGMYPVKSTNALGHVQYTAYDDFLGVMVQSTGPNGIHACFEYDRLGFKTADVARCNASHDQRELTTTTTRSSKQVTVDPISLKGVFDTITVTQPPVGAPSAVRSDRLGRTVESITYDFHGKLVHVDTEYDHLGRVARVSKPHLTGVTGDARSLTTSHYDWLGRIDYVSSDLGSLDGGNVSSTSVVTTSYSGVSIITTQTVKGETRARTEWKNALGKVSQVEDPDGKQIKYTYDSNGNLTDTTDPAGNIVHLDYDELGRKTLTRDPDLGTWTYTYNGFGDLITQTDAKNQDTKLPTNMTYDQLGRMLSKTDPAGNTTEWVYDVGQAALGKLSASISAPSDKLTGACAVPGRSEPTSDRAVRRLDYDEFGNLSEVTECVGGESFVTTYGYDSYGRQNRVTYPEVSGTRFAVESVFSSIGHLHYLADGNDPNSPYWVAKEMNPAGQVTQEYTRNGVEVVATRNTTGWLLGTKATAVPWAGDVVQDLRFSFDEVGSLRTRTRGPSQYLPEQSETFTYDKLDRLHTAEIRNPSASGYTESETFDFDSLGNITAKGGKSYSYTGCNAGPHAVCSVNGGAAYTYDANGNMTKGNGRMVSYDAANKPMHIARDGSGVTVDFAYGAEGQRVIQEVVGNNGGEPSRTVYVGLGATGKSIYERTTTGSKVEHVQFLYAGGVHGGNAIALRVTKDASTTASMKYNLFDHLGSITAMTDDSGRIVGPAFDPSNATVFWYDAWGASRNPDGSRTSTPSSMQPGHRGYTGHENVPGVGLVNMNGRVYDPELGRFLTADPNVQFVANLQSYNRYAYVLNNPLRYTDPTGYLSFGGILEFLGSPRGVELMAVAVCVFSDGAGCAPAFLFSVMVNAGAMALSGDSFDQIALTAGVQIGSYLITAGISGAVVGAGGGGFGTALFAGSISGAVQAGIATSIYTGSTRNLGRNMLNGALRGAMMAGITWYAHNTNPLSEEAAWEQQGGGPMEPPNCNAQCKAAIDKALGGNPLAKYETGWDYIEETGEIGTGRYEGLPKARFQDWVVRKVQPIFDAYDLDYNVADTEIYIGQTGGRSSSPDVGVIRLATPGDDPGASFARTGRSILHELGHQAQMTAAGGYEQFMTTWRSEFRQYGDPRMYDMPGSLEYRADQFANRYLPGLLR